MQVSIVVPAFNEQQRVARTLRQLASYFSETGHSLELIVVDDGSEDNTAEIVGGLGGTTLIRFQHNRGKGAALRRGIGAASGDLIFLVDADLPYSAKAFDRSLPMLKQGACDAVIGARDLPDSQLDPSYPRHRIYMGRAFSHIVNRVLPLGIFDTQCGFKGFRAEVLKKATLYTNQRDYTLDIELLLILRTWGYRIERIPVELIHHHGSKIRTFADSFSMLKSLLRISSDFRRRTYPPSSPQPALEVVPCPLCSSDDSRVLARIAERRFKRCRHCLTIFQSPRLSADLLDRQYDQAYFESGDLMTGYPDYDHRQDLQVRTAAWQWKEVERTLTGGQPTRILDVGCGSSHFLKQGPAAEKDCWGVDLVDLGNEGQMNFRRGSFLEVDLPEGSFDLIVFNDSFEHFPDSGAVLKRSHRLLRPGGTLMINMPDPDSWIARISGTSWISFKNEHLVLYTRAGGRRLFEQHSFRQLRRFPSWQAVDWQYLRPRLQRASPFLAVLLGAVLKHAPGRGFWVPTSGSTWILSKQES